MTGGDLNFLWALRLLKQFVQAGVERCVISPGSRSSPLALAAAALPALRKTVIVDERSAAFFALGASKSDGIPTILICTSGTAVANYLPAVVEAFMTRTPLFLLTADRPAYLQETGSPQTIRQPGIFSHFASLIEVQPAADTPAHWNRLEGIANRAIQTGTVHRIPVHLNIPFDKPLEPSLPFFEEMAAANEALLPGTWRSAPYPVEPEQHIAGSTTFQRPVFVAGPRSEAPLELFFDEYFQKIPLFAEVTSQLSDLPNSIRGFDAFLRAAAADSLEPDLIIRLGKSPVTQGLQRFLENATVPVLSLPEDDLPDDAALNGVLQVSETTLRRQIERFSVETGWFDSWKNLESRAADISPAFGDGFVVKTLFSDDEFREWNLHLSNSMPVRDAELFGTVGWTGRVFCNRGVSGIDGVLSTAIAAAGEAGGQNLLLIGDVAMLHDIGGLMLAKDVNPDLLIVIINNGGGTIFDMLPIRSLKPVFEPLFLTPRNVKWEQAAAAFSIPHRKVDSETAFLDALQDFRSLTGTRILEVVTSREVSMEDRRRIWSMFQQP